jgi:ABC-type transporter Mla subunit MlaD
MTDCDCTYTAADIDTLVNDLQVSWAEVAELKRNLSKAVAALQKVRDFVRDLEPYADQGHTLAPALYDACVILNELEGHKHD